MRLRLMGSGLFDEYPRLADHSRPHGRGTAIRHVAGRQQQWLGRRQRHHYPAKKKIADYFLANFHITTSGNFRTQALIDAMLEIGSDRIMFSTDWPFENVDHAADWFDACDHQRDRPAQDRPHQRAEAVQARLIAVDRQAGAKPVRGIMNGSDSGRTLRHPGNADEHTRRLRQHIWKQLKPQLLDIEKRRLPQMDATASMDDPVAQRAGRAGDLGPQTAMAVAREANDHLAAEVAKQPDRFAGVAALPMQDPEEAAKELGAACASSASRVRWSTASRRSAIENTAVYYDLPQYRPFWAAVEELDVPFYLHPRNPLPGWAPIYDGHNVAVGGELGFAAETAVHALRLIGQRPVRRAPAAEDHPRPPRRGHPVQPVAARPSQRWMNKPPRLCGEEAGCRLHPR